MGGDGFFSIRERIEALKKSIQETARRAGKTEQEIRFILVSKTVALERIREAFEAGVLDFGENKVQELAAKKPQLPSHLRWHMIGHLQTNKVKGVVGEVFLIHSLDRPELAREIEKQAEKKKIHQVPCLIQVNSSREENKSGFVPEEVEGFVRSLAAGSPLEIRGLMTMGPLTDDLSKIREAFRRTRALRDSLRKVFPSRNWDTLSMGMSGDYKTAIEEGATLLRIGTAVFGERGK